MFKKSIAGIFTLVTLLGFSGCVSVRTRIEDRERVDQEIAGMPVTPKKTRQMIVIEITEKDNKAKSVAGTAKAVAVEPKTAKAVEVVPSAVVEAAPVAKDVVPSVVLPAEYKVEKDDTLQKIAKKFYGSHNEWPKVYEANRDVLKNPNFVKPGILLKIPALDAVVLQSAGTEENKN